MNNPDEFLYLIANPMRKKKTYVYENIDEELIILLQKKFKKYSIDEDDYIQLCNKIEEELNEIYLNKFVHNFVKNIFDEVLKNTEV